MGFLQPDMPVVDFAEWNKGTRSEKIRPMARHWAEVGFGTPVVMHLFYVFKILLYILGGWLFALATKDVDGFTNVAQWWTEPIVFEKVVLYTMLFEVVGLGCGFGPLNNRFFPPLGSILYWLRPNTIRLPPWPNRIPLTKGDSRIAGRCRAVRGAAPDADHCAVLRRSRADTRARHRHRRLADVADLDDSRSARGAWPAGQGDLPGRAGRGIWLVHRGIPVGGVRGRPDHRRQAGVRRDLDGCRDVKAEQALPVCDLDDDVEQPADPNQVAETEVLREVPRRFASRSGIAIHRAFQHGDRDVGAVGAVVLPRRLADGDRRIRDALLSLRHPVGDSDGRAAGVERLHDVLGSWRCSSATPRWG